jgi:hypothetical protein
MSEWAGMVPTGRRVAGPAADLVELDDGREGLKHTAIVFHERYARHIMLNEGVELIRSFLEFPMVAGLVEVSRWIPEKAAFVYPTGTTWSATELLRGFRDTGKTMSPKAMVEMLYLAGLVLQEGAQTGPLQGVFSHSSLSTQNLLFKADGQVQIIGYGLPQIELLTYRDDARVVPDDDAYRYCPPERAAGSTEDVDADLFALSMIACELMTGEPLYSGNVEAMRAQAEAGEAARRAGRIPKGRIPGPLLDLFVRSMNPSPDARPKAAEFLADVEKLLVSGSMAGNSLEEMMEEIRTATRRGKSLAADGRGRGVPVAPVEPVRSHAGPIGAVRMATVAAPVARPAAAPPPPTPARDAGEEKRWGKSARRAEDTAPAPTPAPPKPEAAPVAAPATASPAAEDPREKLRARLRPAAEPATPPAGPPATEDPREKLRARLRQNAGGGDTAASATPADAPPAAEAPAPDSAPAKVDPREALKQRLQRAGGEAAPDAASAPTPAPNPAVEIAPAAAAVSDVAPAAAAAAAEPTAAPTSDPKDALRDRLRRAKEGAEGGASAAPATPAAPAAPAADANDPRAALRARLRDRKD